MPSSLPDRFNAPPRKIGSLRGESPRTKCSPDSVRLIGVAIESALAHAGLTKQEASYAMGYENHSMISRWISGLETPQLAKLWTLGDKFQQGFVIALAEASSAGVEVRTVVTLARRLA